MSSSNDLEFLNSRIQEGKILFQNPGRWSDVLKWYDEIKDLRSKADQQAFERTYELDNIRTGVVFYGETVDNPNPTSIDNMKRFVQASIQHLERLKKNGTYAIPTQNHSLFRKILLKWHSLNMSPEVKNGMLVLIGTIAAAIVYGVFIIASAFIQSSPKNTPGKSMQSYTANNGVILGAQQQNAGTINNYINAPMSANKQDESFLIEQSIAGGLYSYFLTIKSQLEHGQEVNTERIKTYLAGSHFLSFDIHTQIGNLLTSIENKNHEAAKDQVKNVINEIHARYNLRMSPTQLGGEPLASADVETVRSEPPEANVQLDPKAAKKDA